MPLYDCMLLLKPHLDTKPVMDLVARVGKHVISRNGVITDIKSFGKVPLGYGIRKLDGRYYQGQLMQLTMMATPNLNKELHYLNKEDRLLRWLLVKHRDMKYGEEFLMEDYTKDTSDMLPHGKTCPAVFVRPHYSVLEKGDNEDEDDDDDEDDEDDADDERK